MTHPGTATLLAHVDRELPDRESNDVATHLASCATCSITVAGFRETGDMFGATLRALDATEPQSWNARATADVQVIPLTPRKSRRTAPGTQWLRRAAAIMLLAGAGAAAAVLTDRIAMTVTEPDAPSAATAATQPVPVAAVSVAPLDGRVSISMTGAAGGSQLFIAFDERQDADVAIESAGAPHFTVVDGGIAVALNGAAAIVRVSLPRHLSEATVTGDGRVLATVTDGQVVPAAALETGITFGTRTTLPNE